MPEGDSTTTPETGTAATQTATGTATATPAKPDAEAKPDDEGKGGKTAILADLAKERDARQELERKLNELTKGQESQRDALALALGIKPEETSDTDKLAKQLTALTEQMTATQRKATLLEVAAEPGMDAEGKKLPAIPKEFHHLLTATETEALQEQAKSLAALLQAAGKSSATPGFISSDGQGVNDGKNPTIAEQIAAAERELAGKTRGTPEFKQQSDRVMALKSQQLIGLKQNQ